MVTFHELVDRHGALRSQGLAAFKLLPEFQEVTDAEIYRRTWEVWQQFIADLLDQVDCPNCFGAGTLGEEPDDVECPTCSGDGSTYSRQIVDVVRPVADPLLPAPTSTVVAPYRSTRPTPLDIDAATTGLLDGQRGTAKPPRPGGEPPLGDVRRTRI